MTKGQDKPLWDIAIEKSKENQKHQISSEESSVLFLGGKNSGKTTMILRYLDRDEASKPTTALEYTFVRKGKGKSLSKDVGHIWELGGGTWLSQLIDVAITTNTVKNTAIYLMLDLSKPEEIWITLEKLLSSLRHCIESSVKESKTVLKATIMERYGENNPDKDIINPFLVPLTIVGGKYDLFQEMEPEKRKVICKSLRFVAHYYGANLIFCSSKIEPLVSRMRQMVTNSLFNTGEPKGPYVDHNKPIIVIAGQDSMEQIGPPPIPEGDLGRIMAKSPIDMWKSAFCSHFPQVDMTDPSLVDDPAKDPQYAEPSIDTIRSQKDEELERYKRSIERKQREKQQDINY